MWWESDNARGSRPHEGGFAKKSNFSQWEAKLKSQSGGARNLYWIGTYDFGAGPP
jgi:hypothetical protein